MSDYVLVKREQLASWRERVEAAGWEVTSEMDDALAQSATDAYLLSVRLPQIGADEFGYATFQWHAGDRSLTLTPLAHPEMALQKRWGSDFAPQVNYVPVMDAHAVREAFKWLAAGSAQLAEPKPYRGPLRTQADDPLWTHRGVPPSHKQRVRALMDAGVVANPTHPGYPHGKWEEETEACRTGGLYGVTFLCELAQTGVVTHWMPMQPATAVAQPDTPKWLTVQQLQRVLADLPPDMRLVTNQVGNIAVLSASGTDFVGYIDFLHEGEYQSW